jgi:acid phosphatase
MNPRRANLLIIVLCHMTAFSCAHSTGSSAVAPPTSALQLQYGHEALQGVLWTQSAVEYRAVARGTYAAATRMLDLSLADPAWSALPDIQPDTASPLPPAVILDIDETCIDNVIYAVESMRSVEAHTNERFGEFVRSGRVSAVPGAREFLEYAHSRGVAIFYVTNQRHSIEDATRRNLHALGFPVDETRDSVLTVGERPEWATADKAPRRNHVAETHRVLLLLGDDFNDFVTAAGKSEDQRRALFERHAGEFGTMWFMLPNPVYGSWERAIAGRELTPEEAFRTKIEALKEE